MKRLAFVILAILITFQAKSQGMWILDNSHSQVMFSVSHLMVGEVTGIFKTFSGSVISSKQDFSDANINFTIDVNSINTENEMRDNSLKSDDFFNAEKFPKIIFKGNGLKKLNNNKFLLTGDLTIRDVTKPITMDVTYNGTIKDNWGNNKAGFKVRGTLNRFDYNLNWNNTTQDGTAIAGKDVEMNINLELAQPAKK